MHRTQIQLPDDLHARLKRLAAQQEWSLSEVLRRGAEYMLRVYGNDRDERGAWRPPVVDVGEILVPESLWDQALAEEQESRHL